MNMRHITSTISNIAIASVLLLGASSTTASARKDTGKEAKIDVSLRIEDETGAPVKGAELIYSEGALSTFSLSDGTVKASVMPGEILFVKAQGYRDLSVALSKNDIPESIVLVKEQPSISGKGSVAAVSSMSGRPMDSFSDLVYSNSLQGRLAGLVAVSAGSGLGNNVPTLYVRGLHRNSGNDAIILVDGMERDIDDIISEEIESVSIMKDAPAKILYGSRAANGVISITTRRGEAGKKVVNTSFESGVRMITRMPQFLNSYDYATLYNEACANDGLLPFYSERQLEGYRNSSGPNDILYPDVDYYGYFMRNTALCDKVTVDMAGGNERVRYSVVMNYIGGKGFEKVGKLPSLDRLNVRGNIDAMVTDYMDIFVNLGTRLETRAWGAQNQVTTSTNCATIRPNEYPLMIPANVLGIEPMEDGTPYFGASLYNGASNMLSAVGYGGFNNETYISSQADFGTRFDFKDYVPGLTALACIGIDNYEQFAAGQTNTYETYAIRKSSSDVAKLQFVKMRNTSLQANQSRNAATLYQQLSFKANAAYERSFGKSNLRAMLDYYYYMKENTGLSQNIRNDNTALRLNYGYDGKLFLEGTLAMMGSNRFAKGNRNFLSYSLGASYLPTENLKVKASVGVLGYDRGTDYLLYATAWEDGSTVTFGETNTNALYITDFTRMGADLKWEYAKEFNVGVEGLLCDGRLSFEVNGFNELRDNIITNQGAFVSSIVGSFSGSANYGSIRNYGVDADIRWSERKGDFAYSIGANLLWSDNRVLSWNEIDYEDEGWKTVGKSTDAILGYKALGLFGKDVDLAGAPVQTLGEYRIGDIAYENQNGDSIIDESDMVQIGNTFPKVNLGIDLNLQYKNWGLFVLGTAALGCDNLLNSTYYWMSGSDKYSVVALDRYHPVNNPDGTYPALTTRSGSNNLVKSSFWIQDASFFRLKNVELSYSFALAGNSLKKIKLFARGANIGVLSEMKDLDPETPNAGLTSYPYYATYTGGLTLTF